MVVCHHSDTDRGWLSVLQSNHDKDLSYMDLKNYTIAPCKEFLFGTDTMGRDIFSMIWYGGRQSLFIGIAATVISTGIAIVFGTVSGMAPDWLDMLLMRATEILLSIPNLLTVIFLQAILERQMYSVCLCDRDYELDEYSQNYQNRSAAAAKQ